MLVHSVFFWLKPDITKDDRDFFFQEVNALAEIESVKGFYCGKPAPTPPREVVDTSYDCGLTVILSDMSGHDSIKIIPFIIVYPKLLSSLGKGKDIRRRLVFLTRKPIR